MPTFAALRLHSAPSVLMQLHAPFYSLMDKEKSIVDVQRSDNKGLSFDKDKQEFGIKDNNRINESNNDNTN